MSPAKAALAVALALPSASCGDEEGTAPTAKAQLTVSAAASLKRAFESYATRFPDARIRYSFAGSDELAAQLRQGLKPDVFAAANTELLDQLHAEGLVGSPVVFAGNRLVIAVPRRSSRVSSVADLERPGVELAVAAKSVPVGSYTRELLGRLGQVRSRRILHNVRSNEPDVAGVVGKLTQGAADAGFVYITDVVGAGGKLRAVELPKELQPRVRYGISVVAGTEQRKAARAFVDGLLIGRGRAALLRAGFEPPPAR